MGQTVLHCLTVFHCLAVLHCQAVNYCVTVLQCLNYSPLPDCLSLSNCSPLFDCSLRLTVLYCLIPSPHIHSFLSLTLVLAMALVMAGKYPWHQTGPEVVPLVVAGIVIIIFQTGPANMGECYLSPSLDGIVGVWNWLVMSSLAPGPQWLLVSVELSSSVTHSRPLEPVLLTETSCARFPWVNYTESRSLTLLVAFSPPAFATVLCPVVCWLTTLSPWCHCLSPAALSCSLTLEFKSNWN